MREYKILTDSTTDLSPQLVAQTGVTVLPMTYTIGEKAIGTTLRKQTFLPGTFTICSAAGPCPPPARSMWRHSGK